VAGGGLFAALKGAVDGGVEVPHGEDVLPSDERVQGAHLKAAASADFEKAKQQIMGLEEA
jgi:large subunit ribosomal protein L18